MHASDWVEGDALETVICLTRFQQPLSKVPLRAHVATFTSWKAECKPRQTLSPIPQSLVIESAADKLRTAAFLTDILSYGATEQGLSSVPPCFRDVFVRGKYIRMPIHGPATVGWT